MSDVLCIITPIKSGWRLCHSHEIISVKPTVPLREPTPIPESRLCLCAPVNALIDGLQQQKIPFIEIKKHGDFGLATFDNLDGEMVMIDGVICQITSDSCVSRIQEDAVTRFPGSRFIMTGSIMSCRIRTFLSGCNCCDFRRDVGRDIEKAEW